MIFGAQKNAQSIFELKNLIARGATPEELLSSMQQTIDSGQATEELIDSANILKTQGIEPFNLDLEKGEAHLQTLQRSGLIDLPGLQPAKVQTTVSVPGGTRQITTTGDISFTPRSQEEILATKSARLSEIQTKSTEAVNLAKELAKVSNLQDKNKLLNKRRSEISSSFKKDSNTSAGQMPGLLSVMKKLKNVSTGSGAARWVKLKRFFKKDVSNEEDFIAATGSLVLDAAKRIQGPLSDGDLAILKSLVPDIGNSVAGNIRILKTIIGIAKHNIGINKLFSKFVKDGGNPEDFDAPLFAVTEKGKTADFKRLTVDELFKELEGL